MPEPDVRGLMMDDPRPFNRLESQRLVDALHALMDAQMGALRERQEDLARAVEGIPIAQRAAVETAMTAAAKATDAALSAASTAVAQAATSHAREHELMATALDRSNLQYIADKGQQNEWRQTLTDLASNKIDSKEVQRVFEGMDARLKTIEQSLANTAGAVSAQKAAVQGQMMLFGVGTTMLALLISTAGIAISYLGK